MIQSKNTPPKQAHGSPDGYIALMSVLAVSAIGLGIVTSALMLSTDVARTGEFMQEAVLARYFSESCAEEALQLVRDTGSCINSSGNLAYIDGTCEYFISGEGGGTCDVQTTGFMGRSVQRALISATIDETGVHLQSWEQF